MKYKRSVLNSPGVAELHRKKSVARRRKLVIYGIILIAVFISLCFISRIKKINISNISVSGNVVVDTKSIEDIVSADTAGNFFGLFPRTNALIYPRAKILHDLSSKYKRLKDINISVNNFQTLQITVNEYVGKYLWCGTVTPELNSNSTQKCYFADNNGYIFDEAPYFSGEIYMKLYGLTGSENPTGTYYFRDIFTKLITFKNTVEGIGLKPAYIWVNNQDEVIFGLSKLGIAPMSPQILLKISSDYVKMAENLKSAIGTDPLQTKLKKDYNKLLYIDLRYGNKVYYKFK